MAATTDGHGERKIMATRNLTRNLTGNLTGPGNRFLKAYGGRNTQKLSDVKSPSQGINYALQELLSGLGIGKDRKDREAFMEAIQAAQVADPSTITAPTGNPERFGFSDGPVAPPAEDVPEEAGFDSLAPNPEFKQIANPNQRSLAQRLSEGMSAPGLAGNPLAQQFTTNMLPHWMAREQAESTYARGRADKKADDRQAQAYEMAQIGAKPPRDSRTPAMRNLEAMGLIPGSPEYSSALQKQMAKTPKYFDPDAGVKKVTFGRYESATSAIDEADKVLDDVNSMLSLVNKADTGTFVESKLALKKAALAMGFSVNEKEIATLEAMKSKGMDFILQRISKTKGAISEKEMNAFKEASASVANTPEGNRMILALSSRVAERMKAEAEAVRAAYGANPRISIKDIDDVKIKARRDFGELTAHTATKNPAGVPAAVWAAMTDGQKALFK
jgi:hypothetical protein